MSPLAPTKRWTAGLALAASLSMVFELRPSFLGLEHGEHGPLDDVEPAVVAGARRAERLLGDDLRQDHVIVGLGVRASAAAISPGVVGGEDVAAPGEVGVEDFLSF